MSNKSFSPKTWHHFKLDLADTSQGGTFPPHPDIGVIRFWVPDAIAMYIKDVRFTN